MSVKSKTVMLKDIPADVDRLIEKEQMRLDLHEDKRLKKAPVVFHIIREWYRLKNIESDLLLKQKLAAEA